MFQKVLLEFFLDTVAGSEIRRFPVEVAILPLLAKVLAPSPGGWPGDFWTINSSIYLEPQWNWVLFWKRPWFCNVSGNSWKQWEVQLPNYQLPTSTGELSPDGVATSPCCSHRKRCPVGEERRTPGSGHVGGPLVNTMAFPKVYHIIRKTGWTDPSFQDFGANAVKALEKRVSKNCGTWHQTWWVPKKYVQHVMGPTRQHQKKIQKKLVGGFNPFEKY